MYRTVRPIRLEMETEAKLTNPSTIKEVRFVSRREAESIDGFADWAIISISDPFHYPATLKGGWHSVLRLEFSDIEQESKLKTLFSEKEAREVVDFVRQANAAGCAGVLVHCKAGVSRSAAIAKWIATQFNLPNDHYAGYNRHIFAVLSEVGRGHHGTSG